MIRRVSERAHTSKKPVPAARSASHTSTSGSTAAVPASHEIGLYLLEHRDEQIFLVAEVVVQRALGDRHARSQTSSSDVAA